VTHLSRRTLLRRVGALTVVGGLAVANPLSALADDDLDFANLRLMASAKRLTIQWYTRWLDAPGLVDATTRPLALTLRKHEQEHYRLLAAPLGATAPTDDDFTFSFPAAVLRSPAAALAMAATLERLVRGTGIGVTSTTTDQGAAAALARVVAADSAHVAVLDGLHGARLGPSLPVPLDVPTASAQLGVYLH
jgi:Ferritin-like domain